MANDNTLCMVISIYNINVMYKGCYCHEQCTYHDLHGRCHDSIRSSDGSSSRYGSVS